MSSPTSRTTVGHVTRRARIALLAVAAAGLAGCAKDAPQDTWKPAGPNAQKIANLQTPVFIIAGVVGLIVFGVVGYVVWRYRDRGQAIPEQTHGKPTLEIGLTILPALILIGVAIPTVSTVIALNKTSDTQCVINVTGQQWWWEVDYPVQDGCGGVSGVIVTSGQMVIPVGTPVLVHGHQPRRDPLVLDPPPQRQARRGPGPRPDEPHRGRRARHLLRPVHRVLRPVARQHAHGSHRHEPGRLRGVEGQPARGVHAARRRHAGGRGRGRSSSRSARVATRSTASRTPTGTRSCRGPTSTNMPAPHRTSPTS